MFYCYFSPKFVAMNDYKTLVFIDCPSLSGALSDGDEIKILKRKYKNTVILPYYQLVSNRTRLHRLGKIFGMSAVRLAGRRFSRKSVRFAADGLLCADAIEKWIEKENIDCETTLFYTQWLTTPAVGLAWLSQRLPINFICRADDVALYSDEYHDINELVISKAQRVLTSSNAAAEFLARSYPAEESKIVCSIVGTLKSNREFMTTGHLKAARLLTFFSLDNSPDGSGSKIPFKLMRAVAIARPDTSVRWIRAGRYAVCGFPDDSIPNNLEIDFRLVDDWDDVESVFLSETIDWSLFISPIEVRPKFAMMSLSYDVPVVASMVPGLDEVVTDDCGLLLAEDTTPEEFVLGLLPYIESDIRMASLRSRAFDFWSARFDAG